MTDPSHDFGDSDGFSDGHNSFDNSINPRRDKLVDSFTGKPAANDRNIGHNVLYDH